ncbi:MAG: phosphoglucosamine mutase [Bryobacterales bacterium]
MAKRLFGTDGIRGVAGTYPLDPPTVYAAGLALGRRLSATGGGAVLIGMDTRESGPEIAECLAAGLEDAGIQSRFAGVLPTAGVSYLTEAGDFAAGVMISASHNPFEDNGIKVFGSNGYKLADAIEHEVEDGIFAVLDENLQPRRRALEVDPDLEARYLAHLLSAGDLEARLKPLRLAVDCSNGAASRLAGRYFDSLGIEAEVFADQPDGRNINVDCGSLHLERLQEKVRQSGADLGVAFDGDADRALLVADDGSVVDGDTILLLAGRYLDQKGALPGRRLVTTVMANMGLEAALREAGIAMARTAVGDKYVLEEMVASGSELGGEQSGHIIFKRWANTGDGLLTARMMLEVLSDSGEPLSQMRQRLVVFPQRLVNVRVKAKPDIATVPVLADAIAAAERRLGDRGRVLVRYSGTEPLLRIMIEAADAADVDELCESLRHTFEAELGA